MGELRTVTAQSCVAEWSEQGHSNANNPLIQEQLCSGSVIPCLTTSPRGDSSSVPLQFPHTGTVCIFSCHPLCFQTSVPLHAAVGLQECPPALDFHLCFGAGHEETFPGKGSAVLGE